MVAVIGCGSNGDLHANESEEEKLARAFNKMIEDKAAEYSKLAAIDSENTDQFITERCSRVRDYSKVAADHILAIDAYEQGNTTQYHAEQIYTTYYSVVSAEDNPFRTILIWIRDNVTLEQQKEVMDLVEVNYYKAELSTINKGHLEIAVRAFGVILPNYTAPLGYHREEEYDGYKQTATGTELEEMKEVTDFLIEAIPAINRVFKARCGSGSNSLVSVPPLPLLSR